jgi:amidase
MDPVDLAYAGITRQAQLIAAGELSARDLLEVYLERIQRLDPQLNAFRVVFRERARMEADQADARVRSGDPAQLAQRPLLGVPIAVKDDLDVAGEVTALGSNAYGDPAAADCEVVRRLREAGAIVIGKTNVPELCAWNFTETATWGVTRNPWELQHTPGGSSGGSGAAVAAGLVGAATGSDGAGSIRIPSAWCNLFGLKPQRGRVSLAPHAETWHGLSVNGALTRTVADAALIYDVISGSTPVDRERAPELEQSFREIVQTPPEKLRVALSTRAPQGLLPRVDADARRTVDEMGQLLRSLGHEVVQADPDYGPGTVPAVLMRFLCGLSDEARAMAHPKRLERRSRELMRAGSLIPRALLERSRAGEAQLRERISRVLVDHDVLVTPTTSTPPMRVGRLQGRGGLWTVNDAGSMVPHLSPFNVTGQPACSVPAGFDGEGLPRGVQLVARPNQEGLLLALAAQIEAARPWAGQRPPLFS